MQRIINVISPTNQILYEDSSPSLFVDKILDSEQTDIIEPKKIKFSEDQMHRIRTSMKLVSRPRLTLIKSPTNKSFAELTSQKNMMLNRRNSRSSKEPESKLLQSELLININKKNSMISTSDANSPTNQYMMSVHNIIEKCNAAQQSKTDIK